MTTATYPTGGITPHGTYYDSKGRYPTVHLLSHDQSTEFYLMGGKSIPWPNAPECVRITKDGIKGLIAPWKRIAQKSATEDGETFIDSLFDPAEPELSVKVRARDPKRLQQVTKTLIASIDGKRTSRLTITNQVGERWFADVRWNKTPTEHFVWGDRRYQQLTLRLLIDGALWRSDTDISGLGFEFDSHTDDFTYNTLSPGGVASGPWTVAYVGDGTDGPGVDGHSLVWVTSGGLLATGRSAVMRYTDATASSDDMITEMVLASSASGWALGDAAANALWLAMNNTGPVGGDGVRAWIELGSVKISSFVSSTEHVLKIQPILVAPQHGDRWQLVRTGTTISVVRNGTTIATTIDTYNSQHTGASFRSCGIEMHAGPTLVLPTLPAPVDRWSMSSNNTTVQGTQIRCVNIGDQPMYRDYVMVGPGTFSVAVRPGSDDMVSMGPLLAGQVVMIRTDPRKTTIVDLTSTPPTPQQLNDFQQAVKDFTDWASGGNAPPLLQEIQSSFGIQPPQGNLYSLLSGRFSTASAIPPAPAAGVAAPVFVNASIVGGTGDSKLISVGVPLRRYPL